MERTAKLYKQSVFHDDEPQYLFSTTEKRAIEFCNVKNQFTEGFYYFYVIERK